MGKSHFMCDLQLTASLDEYLIPGQLYGYRNLI